MRKASSASPVCRPENGRWGLKEEGLPVNFELAQKQFDLDLKPGAMENSIQLKVIQKIPRMKMVTPMKSVVG